jgi:hypothetical protein
VATVSEIRLNILASLARVIAAAGDCRTIAILRHA